MQKYSAYVIFQRAIVQFAEDSISTFVTQEAMCCVIQIRNVVHSNVVKHNLLQYHVYICD